ncbi:MAG: hypothetical protein A2550_01360, partial [Candidatus Jacksonbacteria bacterium RIFOXYD2_FULL_43_21]
MNCLNKFMKPSLGLQRGTVRLEPYNPEWKKLFESEKSALEEMLGDKFIAVEHVGSTAIPGIKAKPILDLMLAIEDLENWEWVKEPLTKLGYEFRRDFRKEQGHILFVKGPEENRTHYLKITESDSDFWNEHILFRNYLVNNPQYREEYQNLKEKLFDEHAGNREPYTKGKEEFVRKILALAGFKG